MFKYRDFVYSVVHATCTSGLNLLNIIFKPWIRTGSRPYTCVVVIKTDLKELFIVHSPFFNQKLKTIFPLKSIKN